MTSAPTVRGPAALDGTEVQTELEVAMITDPVCGKRINRGKAHVAMEHKGVVYFLCCPLCQKAFERAPDSYARPEAGEKIRRKPERHPYRAR